MLNFQKSKSNIIDALQTGDDEVNGCFILGLIGR